MVPRAFMAAASGSSYTLFGVAIIDRDVEVTDDLVTNEGGYSPQILGELIGRKVVRNEATAIRQLAFE
jgi:hypothetical protein